MNPKISELLYRVCFICVLSTVFDIPKSKQQQLSTTYRINLKMTTIRQIRNSKLKNIFIACYVIICPSFIDYKL